MASSPKTIIITHIPKSTTGFASNHVKMASLLPQTSPQQQQQQQSRLDRCILQDNKMSSVSPRKRQRLDHLSMEEKMMRRKLKNRVAAQSARDRKRVLMQDLEVEVRQLEIKNSSLQDENERLQERNEKLEKENAELQRRLKSLPLTATIKQEPIEEESVPKSNGQKSVEYASLISDPLPKGQDSLAVALWMTHFVGLLMWNLTNYLTSCKNSHKSWDLMTVDQKPRIEKLMKMGNPSVEWWGPHQRNWNPSKN